MLRPRLLALLLPTALIGGALISQYGFGLYPCEMCHWQRWPHYAAMLVALGALMLGQRPGGRAMLWLAILLIATSGAIGLFHAGVEYHWWQGLTTCTSNGPMTMDDLLGQPLVRCDVPQWQIFGISLAGFNALFSLGGAALIGWLALREARAGRAG